MKAETYRAVCEMVRAAVKHYGGDTSEVVVTVCRPQPWERRRQWSGGRGQGSGSDQVRRKKC
jgi:hypothetical protein